MDLDKAIERVKRRFFQKCAYTDAPCGNNCVLCVDNEALRIVVAAAKEPGLTREQCLWLKEHLTLTVKDPYPNYASGILAKLDGYAEALRIARAEKESNAEAT